MDNIFKSALSLFKENIHTTHPLSAHYCGFPHLLPRDTESDITAECTHWGLSALSFSSQKEMKGVSFALVDGILLQNTGTATAIAQTQHGTI